MKYIFSQEEIKKKQFDDRWVRFAFGPQGLKESEGLNLGIVNFSKNRTALNHRHHVEEALFVLAGSAQIKINGKNYPIKKNDFIYVPRETDHQVITSGSGIKILFVFGGEIIIEH
jgi:mannose-6-phosphate isomerase-like protein (cupin superfamily)